MTIRNNAAYIERNRKHRVLGVRLNWLKPLVFILCLLPLVLMIYELLNDNLGANPIEALSRLSGEWTLRFLILGLTATPLQILSGWGWPVRIRRMIGLYAFFYACVHVLIYIWLDQQLQWSDILGEVVGKPYLIAGMIAILILLPLAITSNRAMMRRLGKNWKVLHQWVYFAALAACLHYVWLAKGDKPEPIVYLLLLLLLLFWRLVRVLKVER